MHELWLARDEAYVLFDVKQSKEILECPKFEGDVSVFLTDEEYADYCETLVKFYVWQRKFEDMIKAGDAVNAVGRFL